MSETKQFHELAKLVAKLDKEVTMSADSIVSLDIEILHLEQQKVDLLAALRDIESRLSMVHEHDCAGWACNECNPNILSGIIGQAIADVEGGE